jgi:hypothetical protein
MRPVYRRMAETAVEGRQETPQKSDGVTSKQEMGGLVWNWTTLRAVRPCELLSGGLQTGRG